MRPRTDSFKSQLFNNRIREMKREREREENRKSSP